ncbi:MAG TPA: hypothetical protein VF713_21975, partial [Thermoanaerobaculia bacterium]
MVVWSVVSAAIFIGTSGPFAHAHAWRKRGADVLFYGMTRQELLANIPLFESLTSDDLNGLTVRL